MRTKCVSALLVMAAALAVPASAQADALRQYRVTVDAGRAAVLERLGVDLGHTGYKASDDGPQTIFVDLFDGQADKARDEGLRLDEEVPGPHVSQEQVDQRAAATQTRSRGTQRAAKPETGGDSTNPFYDVFRSYSEPGGVKDEMARLASEHPGMAKLVTIGTSGQGQPIVAIKVTRDARNVADGARPAMLFSAVNHAREWIAAEVGRRMPRWWLENADDPEVAELLDRAELWFLPIMNPDGYDYTFTCGPGFRTENNVPCGATLVTDENDPLRGTYVYKDAQGETVAPNAAQPDASKRKPTNRLWRKTLRDNNAGEAGSVVGDNQDGVDPNRNYPTAWGLDEEGASNNRASGTYRGPKPLSETEDLAYDRLLRKITPEAVINYHSAAQLLLYPFGYITDVFSDDDAWFKAITGTDGDAAVDPYISQRSSDLYITNGETTDHAYNKYGSMSWTPELDECQTAAGGSFCSGGSGFTFPDDEGKVRGVFEKNLDFARNVAATTLDTLRPDRPRNATDDATQYQVKGSPDIEPNRFGVSYGREQVLETTARRVLGPVDFVVQVGARAANGSVPAAAGRTLTLRAEPWRGGERFGDLRGKYYQRVRATVPADFVQPGTAQAARPLEEGEVVNVSVIAGSQQQRFSYRVESVQQDASKKRVLVLSAEDYEGLSPNKTPYDTAPRYADEHRAALEAAGYEVEVYDTSKPPTGGSALVNDLGVLSHFDAVVYSTGDDLVPQAVGEGVTDEDFRREVTGTNGAPALNGNLHLTNPGVRNAQMVRNFQNEGGKVVLSGRGLWVQQTSTGTGLTSYSGYSWWQEPQYGFSYPANQGGDDDRPATAFFRELDISNDWSQWWLGVGNRQGGPGTTATYDGQPVVPAAGSFLDGLAPIVVDSTPGAGATLEPTENRDTGADEPRNKSVVRLRTITNISPGSARPFRQEAVQADYANGGTATVGGAIVSTRDSVAFGFGLEQITDPAVREQVVQRSLAYLLPAGPDTTAPAATFLRPGDGEQVDVSDPVEVEVEAADERGDIKEVRLKLGDELIGRKVSFPFQLRWQAAPGDVGTSKTLTAEVEDKAGNVTTTSRTFQLVPASRLQEAPLPTGRTSIAGRPLVGEVLACTPSGFSGDGIAISFAWLRDGQAIAGATGDTLRLTEGDLGREVACRTTARNEAGDADSTSEALTVSAAAAGEQGPKGDQGQPGQPGRPGEPGRSAEAPKKAASFFAFGSVSRITLRRGRATVTFRAPGRGQMVATLRARIGGEVVPLATRSVPVGKAGEVRVALTVRADKLRSLQRTLAARRTKRTSAILRATFLPAGAPVADGRTRNRSVSLTLR